MTNSRAKIFAKTLLSAFLVATLAFQVACAGQSTQSLQDVQVAGRNAQSAPSTLQGECWAQDVKAAVNGLVATYGKTSSNYKDDTYAVFDFDNTCSIFDTEEALFAYQLQTMSFAITPSDIRSVLACGLGVQPDDEQDLNSPRAVFSKDGVGHSYNDWLQDVSSAYAALYEKYGPFTAKGLDEAMQAKVQADPLWSEFAAKKDAMYQVVADSESWEVAYQWSLRWFYRMTEQDVYDMARAMYAKWGDVDTVEEVRVSPADISSKVGVVEIKWTRGVSDPEGVKELWKTLSSNGIDVWVCSASEVSVIRAAIDAFGLHEYCTGVLGMTMKKDASGKYTQDYDYETGYGFYALADGGWKKMDRPTKAATGGIGKVTAISNAIAPEYKDHGPIAGFMDSTGDFNFCTEFSTLKLVLCYNRASRKVTDGGGLISEVAIYQRDHLGYDLARANSNGDTLYVLQGRDENGKRSLRPSNSTLVVGSTAEKLFVNAENEAELAYMVANNMSTRDILNKFAITTPADSPDNPLKFKYGFLKEYAGYHSRD